MAAKASLSTPAYRNEEEICRDEESHEMTYLGACLFAVLICFGGRLAQWELSYLGLLPRPVERVESACEAETNAPRTTLEPVYDALREPLASRQR